jgi:hypothetical protein
VIRRNPARRGKYIRRGTPPRARVANRQGDYRARLWLESETDRMGGAKECNVLAAKVEAQEKEYERGRAEEYQRTVQERERWDTLLAQAEAKVEAQAKEIEHLKDRVENLLHRMTSEEAAKEIERLKLDMINLTANLHARELEGYREREREIKRLRGLIAGSVDSEAGLWDLNAEARRIREEEGRDGKA